MANKSSPLLSPSCGRTGEHPGAIEPMSQLDDYLKKNRPRFESELCELLRIPSVSAVSQHAVSTAIKRARFMALLPYVGE